MATKDFILNKLNCMSGFHLLKQESSTNKREFIFNVDRLGKKDKKALARVIKHLHLELI